MQYVVNNKRTACRVAATLGGGIGGVLGVADIGPAPDREDALRGWLVEVALPAALGKTGMVAVHLGEADAGATTVRTDEKKLLQAPDATARWLVLLEGVDRDLVTNASAEMLGDAALRAAGVDGEIERGMYQLGFLMGRSP
jgi:hypothetical protein